MLEKFDVPDYEAFEAEVCEKFYGYSKKCKNDIWGRDIPRQVTPLSLLRGTNYPILDAAGLPTDILSSTMLNASIDRAIALAGLDPFKCLGRYATYFEKPIHRNAIVLVTVESEISDNPHFTVPGGPDRVNMDAYIERGFTIPEAMITSALDGLIGVFHDLVEAHGDAFMRRVRELSLAFGGIAPNVENLPFTALYRHMHPSFTHPYEAYGAIFAAAEALSSTQGKAQRKPAPMETQVNTEPGLIFPHEEQIKPHKQYAPEPTQHDLDVFAPVFAKGVILFGGHDYDPAQFNEILNASYFLGRSINIYLKNAIITHKGKTGSLSIGDAGSCYRTLVDPTSDACLVQ
ncbi:MAG: hypothetical protein Q3972_02665 [Corynebacterium sp.]|nr:hypothetical protein [Corynebacterium sp.]